MMMEFATGEGTLIQRVYQGATELRELWVGQRAKWEKQRKIPTD
jgi:hypothetical protein